MTNDCGSAVDSIFIRLVTNVPQTTNKPQITVQICPNPAADFIQILGYTDGFEKIEIYNQIGQLVMVIVDKNSLMSINVSMLSKGVYYLKIDTLQRTAKPLKFVKT